ncbi:MAG TPA: alkyl sulfatase dimerization domain-containing protein [Parvibaculum sp.]|uniref:alkyl/aryl-sulfatase n=1 Tax=Parvibaculum sp. TaxID=2024848 RepID=UPI002C0B2647|nr:alkyl sulfatase dimerization domain-containing protein [Parvibaculum sp.]HMM15063.1 alkyl sulfatase dimerization domain-containing protein [Parvibaculum sp.]
MPTPKDATEATCRAHAHVRASLPADTGADFENSRRGFIDTIPDAKSLNEAGFPVWDMGQFAFEVEGSEAPDTVNPSLWRQAQLNSIHGLFKVTDGIYQVRNFDLSNITFIEGEKGIIVIDPLISSETARSSLDLYRKHRGERPVTAVIYTHSHVDHYGGVKGVLTDDDLARGDVRIIAPEGFLEHAVSENVLAGNAMGRRATYMYGALLPRGPKGHVDAGLGKTVSLGQVSLVPPNEIIKRTGEKLVVDGVEIVFQMTPDTEAPAEMNFYFPGMKALCMAENCSCHLHNIYTPRGAQVRDAKSWSYYINEAIELFGGDTDVLFASHHWPRWGRGDVITYLEKQRDLYKYIHDQTLRLANHGLTPLEIAEEIALPPTLASEWYTRDYYGTLSHNAKAVYQRYLGWFDGNPAHLRPLPPVEAAKRYVEFMGGADALLGKARASYDKGDYRWVAEVVNHLVFADPANAEARHLQADALEQLGYQAESGPWRGFYLTAAMELRNPRPPSPTPRPGASGQVRALPAEQLLDSLSVRLNGPTAGAKRYTFNVSFTDTGETYLLSLENAVLHHARGKKSAKPDASLTITKPAFAELVLHEKKLDALIAAKLASVDGDAAALVDFVELLDIFDFWFEIVMP